MSNVISDLIVENQDLDEDPIVNMDNNSTNNEFIKKLPLYAVTMASTVIVHGNNINIEDNLPKIQNIISEERNIDVDELCKFILIDDYDFGIANLEFRHDRLIENVLSFKMLSNNWDGYGALPLEVKSAANSLKFLSIIREKQFEYIPNDVFSNPNGTISFIWENEYSERISLEIGNNSMSYYVKYESQEPLFFDKIEVSEFELQKLLQAIKTLF